ncbi:MAG: phage major capsid protein [Hafnia sp.]
MHKAENLNMKGLMSIRAARACALSKSGFTDAIEMTRQNDPQVSAYLEKSLVLGTGIGGMPLLSTDPIARELGEYIFAQTLPGKLLAKAMQMPFGAPLASIFGSGADWVKEGEAVPVTKGDTSTDKLMPYKIASVTVLNNELLTLATTGATLAIRNTMCTAAVRKIDSKFLSQDAAIEALSPAGVLTNADTASDFADLLKKHTDNGNSLSTSALVLPLSDTLALTEAQFKQFELLGVCLIASQYATKAAIIDAANMIISIQGALIDVSEEGSIEMDDAPSNNINDPKASKLFSLFQNNATAFRAVTYCSWKTIGKAVTVISS